MSRFLRVSLLALLALAAFAPPAPAQSPTGLVINEIDYDQPSLDTAEFLEIRNNGAASVNLDTYALRFVNGANGGAADYRTVDLPAVDLGAGAHYVVCGNPATVTECDLDANGAATQDLIQNGEPDAVALLESAVIVDTVSYEGEVPGYTEGAAGAPTDTATATESIARVPDGCDTDQNAADFKLVAGTPGAANGAGACGGPSDAAPAVAESDPANGDADVGRDANARVTFTEPVTAADAAFSLTCDGTAVALAVTREDAQTYVLDPQQTLPVGATCTLRVEGDDYRDDDAADPPDTGTDYAAIFTTHGVEGLRIHDIQGAAHVSPHRGAIVASVPGVVTARRTNGYFIQDPQPDGDVRTSEGIFVFTGSTTPDPLLTPGTAVTVSGRVTEFRAGGATSANLSTTELTSATAVPSGSGAIAPTVVGRGGRVPPREIVDNDTVDPGGEDPTAVSGDVDANPAFDPQQDGLDFYESLEGMLTEVRNAVAVAPTSDFGSNRELPVLANNGADANVRAPRGPIVVRGFDSSAPQEFRRGDFNPERIILNDANHPGGAFLPTKANVRDRFTAPVRAVVDYSFGNFKFLALNNPPLTDGRLQPEQTRKRDRDELAVASYNVENLDGADDQERFDRVADQIVDSLRSPDILSLEEVQDDDGAASAAPTAANLTHSRLIEAIVRAGGPRYDYRQIDPLPDSDGGEPNGNIRISFLFRTDVRDLRFVDRPGGTATTATEPVAGPGGAQLTLSPGRVDPTNPVFNNSRKPLAGEFRYRGKPLFVVGNHFNSKGGDDPVFGRFQEPRRPSELVRRGSATAPGDTVRGQAGVLNAFVRDILDIDPRARVVVLGDFNDFDFSETLRVLEQGPSTNSGPEMVNLWRLLPRAERYSYIFQGNAQVLDHILVSPSLLLRGSPDFDPVHINTEYSDQASDHDPPIVRFELDD